MNISFTPQVVKVTAQPPGLKAQTAATGGDVIITPQALAVSALSSALGVDIQNPIGRDIIQGMDYESGSWTEIGNTRFLTHNFSRQHKNPPFMFLVHASVGQIRASTTYGQMFINYLSLLGFAPMISYTQAKYGTEIYWTTGSSTTTIGQSVTSITSKTALDNYATNERFQFGSSSLSSYIRDGVKYNWVAAFMPEE